MRPTDPAHGKIAPLDAADLPPDIPTSFAEAMSYRSEYPQESEEYEQYLRYIADLNISIKEKYELIHIVTAILSYFVDQAFNVQTDQITLQSARASGSNSTPDHGMIQRKPENQTSDARREGVEGDSNPQGPSEP